MKFLLEEVVEYDYSPQRNRGLAYSLTRTNTFAESLLIFPLQFCKNQIQYFHYIRTSVTTYDSIRDCHRAAIATRINRCDLDASISWSHCCPKMLPHWVRTIVTVIRPDSVGCTVSPVGDPPVLSKDGTSVQPTLWQRFVVRADRQYTSALLIFEWLVLHREHNINCIFRIPYAIVDLLSLTNSRKSYSILSSHS
jgi:hypothetical protein